MATEAGRLLGRFTRGDAVDALVAVTAMCLVRPAIILTSDPADLSALTVDHEHIQAVAI